MLNKPKFIASSLICACASWLAPAALQAAPSKTPAPAAKAAAPANAAAATPPVKAAPATPAKPAADAKAATPATPAKPGGADAKAATPATPPKPAADAKAAAPAAPAKPGADAKPTAPAAPATPGKPPADTKAAPAATTAAAAGAKPADTKASDAKAADAKTAADAKLGPDGKPVADGKAAADPKAAASGATPAAAATPGTTPAAGAAPAEAQKPPPSPEIIAEAKQRFDRGLELYAEGDYPLALIEFNRAYELVPNYRVLYNIGQVCIQLGQYANARRALREYVQRGGEELSNHRKESVSKDLEMLEHRTAFLLVTSNVPDAEVLVDDVVVGKTPLVTPLLVDAGVHRVVVRRNGFLPRNTRVTLAGGDEQTVPLALEKQPEAKPTIVVQRPTVKEDYSTLMIAGWVTTGALAAGAIVTGIMGAGEAKELKELRSADPAQYTNLGARMDSTKSNASALLLASDVFSGAALVVGGLSLWITVSPPESAPPPSPERPTPPPPKGGLQVGFNQNQLKLRGSF